MNIINIEINKIKSDPLYQRKMNMSIINEIVNNYNENLLGVVTIVKRKNEYYCVDGQHRIAALSMLGKSRVDGIIIENEDNEAQLFIDLNTKRKHIAYRDLFKAKCQAGNKESIEINNIVAKNGYFLATATRVRAQNCIKAINSVETIYSKYGSEHLDLTLSAIRRIYGIEAMSINREFLVGYALFLKKVNIELSTLVQKMSKIPPQKLKNMHDYNMSTIGLSSERAMAKAILDFYNQNKKQKLFVEF